MKRMFLIYGFVSLRSAHIARLLFAALILVLLSTADVSAQLDTVWQFPGAYWVAPDGCGGAFVTDSIYRNGVTRVDSTGAILWHQDYTPPAWPWQDIMPKGTILDYSKSVIGVWWVSRYWVDEGDANHWQYGCAAWKYDSLGTFQWEVYTQFPDSEWFWPQAVTVDSNDEIAIFGWYSFDQTRPCEPQHEAAVGIMRISSGGTMSFDIQCGQPQSNIDLANWPEDPHQVLTYPSSDKEADSCLLPMGNDYIWDFTFYTHTLYRYANGSIQKLALQLKGTRTPVPLPENQCGFDYTEYSSAWQTPQGLPIYLECDSAGNTFEIIKELSYEAVSGLYSCRYWLAKYSIAGELLWMTPLSPWYAGYDGPWSPMDVVADHEGSAIVGCPDGIRKFNSGGALQWYVPTPSEITDSTRYVRLAVDIRNNVYAFIWAAPTYGYYRSWFLCLGGKSGEQRYVYPMGVGAYVGDSHLIIDSAGCIYANFAGGAGKLRQNMSVVIRDAHGDSLPDAEFTLIRVSDNAPTFTEDTLGLFTTDSLGTYKFPMIVPDSFEFKESQLDVDPDTLGVGELFKVTRRVYDTASVKHPSLVGTQYSVHLDNLHIDADGAVAFDTVDGKARKEVVLNHTELRYNLLVSVEWDAAESYLSSLQDGFRAMSNYLYDVSDGQVRLDTVMIYDNKTHWDEADVRIYASNMVWPHVARLNGITQAGSNGAPVEMPRKWFGCADCSRNGAYSENPLNLEDDHDFRTKCHELGHYAFNFGDEYEFSDGSGGFVSEAGRCASIPIYGYMDNQFESGGEWSSEMSSIYRYQDAECQNTEQFIINYGSCWDYLEEQFEKEWGTDSIFIPIITPDDAERELQSGFEYLPGPNGEMFVLDYDVGALVQFPEQPLPPDPDIATLDVQVENATNRLSKADVTLINNYFSLNPKTIYQGQTDDGHGRIWVVGASQSNRLIQASTGQVTILPYLDKKLTQGTGNKVWMCGEASVGAPNEKRVNNSSWSSGDSVIIQLKPVAGDYPLICGMNLGDNTATYQLNILNTFSTDPTIDLLPDIGGQRSYNFTYDGTKYTAQINDTLGNAGTFTIWAVDDLAQNFFFNTDYTITQLDTSAVIWNLMGPEGGAEVWIDTSNSTLQKGMILSSPYLIIRTGLDTANIQAGETHSFSVYPPTSLTGNNRFIIRYADSDLDIGNGIEGKESSLKIFHWNEGSNQWEQIGGTVDTIQNQVSTTITALGVYGAFTTELVTGVKDEEHGSVIPEKFELKQNYPNPFNPVCNIEYALPKGCKVTLAVYNILGQKVRVLVDEYQNAGYKSTKWDGRDNLGREVTSGIYFYRIEAGEFVQAKKMVLIE